MATVKRGKALVASLRAQAGVRDPEALAAYLGRFKKARKAGASIAKAKAAAKSNGSSNGKSAPSKPKRITKDEVNKAPWKFSASQYQIVHGVSQPHIAEISPMQYAHLSKRGKKEYDEKRNKEWQASADIKSEWREKVRKAADDGRINKDTPSLSEEARSTIIHRGIEKDKEKAKRDEAAAAEANTVRKIDDIEKGQELHHNIYERVRVVRKSKKSIRVLILNRDGSASKNRDGSDSTINIPVSHIEHGFLKKRKRN